MTRFKKEQTPQTISKRVGVKKHQKGKTLAQKTIESFVSSLCLSSQCGNDFLIMTIVLVLLVAVCLLLANTQITKCVAFPDCRAQSCNPALHMEFTTAAVGVTCLALICYGLSAFISVFSREIIKLWMC